MTRIASRYALAALIASGVALTGCGGGSSTPSAPKVAPPVAAGCGAASGASVSGSVPLTSSAQVQYPTLGYCTTTLTIPTNNTIGGTGIVDVTVGLNAPSGVATPPPGNGTNGVPAGENPATIFWLTQTPETGVTLTSPTSPTLTITFYGLGSCTTFYSWNVPATGTGGAYTTAAFTNYTAVFGGQVNTTPVVFSARTYSAIACL